MWVHVTILGRILKLGISFIRFHTTKYEITAPLNSCQLYTRNKDNLLPNKVILGVNTK